MAIRVGLTHHTRYEFDRLVRVSPHVIRLRPAAHSRTPVLGYSLNIAPEPFFIHWQQDPFGNWLARVTFPEPVRFIEVNVDLIAELTVINPFDFFVESYAEQYPFAYDGILAKELVPYLEVSKAGPLLQAWLDEVPESHESIVDFLVELNRRLNQDIAYSVRMEVGIQSCEETLERRIGSCRDSAWLLAQILRHKGLAARFVSGYLVQLKADEKSLDGPSGTEADFTDLHAWTEVYIPGAGWVGLDPTSGLFAGEGHIPLACTPDPISAAPVTGYTEACEVSFVHDNRVQRIHEDPRVTRPYSDDQWVAIDALGQRIDAELRAMDVRLTMGGEPTFVSIDDMDGPEWNTRADGPDKRRLSRELSRRLRERFAPGGLLHFGQGKWYPGEALPRWALGIFWRRDGQPVWHDAQWLADFSEDYGHNLEDARRFAETLVVKLGLTRDDLIPAFEDPFHAAWSEDNLPLGLDPEKADLKAPAGRQRLARFLSHGLENPAGFVLPLAREYETWRTGPWPFRDGRLRLIPGDSPMGLRLPLDRLPWSVTREVEIQPQPRDPFDEPGPLPVFVPESGVVPVPQPDRPRPSTREEVIEIPHTALAFEARNGRLHLFMPPLPLLEDYLALVDRIETTAAELGLPVVLEGYEPPRDSRLQRLMVTPDPGVIEVNIHPSSNWEELKEIITTLYAEARLTRLGTEKFMLDGRHTGTGGGNHVTLGGATAADSPLLRRPDLLGSLLTFWQHHPGLSYLFSGTFIGPTSQAPRVDEARHENLYELEIALSQMPEGECAEPWLVDRLFRNLLVDITGNTHRAEFCIDKLYSPDTASGRLGILELRAFEMPPHARMSLVQMLLLRTLVARFWSKPYRHRLVRWGTALHDRFLLPHYVENDLREVVEELQRDGYPFDLEWLAPFFEFRFPTFGRVQIGEIEIELKMAIEPWHVLGEEVTQSGTSRFVDSSLERLQVRVTGLSGDRYVLTCNGRRVPLRPTRIQGTKVAGVRYRAWQPAAALHPTIAVHSPLVFDLVDTWNGRAIGGCTYHVVHPGGRNYETFPVNAFEAEARRMARFWPYGHSPGPLEPRTVVAGPVASERRFLPEGSGVRPLAPPAEGWNPEYPHTLDLRRGPEPSQ
ncbi:DUF2126 domain-containing protein [Thioalkalivibrio sp.]|uniref:transglutaminase family protein n=1 Tax=Thioalkalivibrio sp. TaxID=2093813 RepID=UPI0012D4EE55|nr:transglutaminase family protein [Thioalkalivibrio sp.]TVP77318.1 MAG: transglutaminase family protein [Thioalkalivibrio sp.]